MSARTQKINGRASGLGLLLAITVIFIILRFVHIEADFPSGITSSMALYTDEGWHLSGAVNLIVTGQWYVKGDFNPAVNLPVGHLIQALTFSTFGMSLASARSTVVVFFALLVALVIVLLRKHADWLAALFASFFLAVNFFAFAYSRFAILEILMSVFVLLAFLIADSLRHKSNLGVIACSSLILLAAVLTKSTAVSALPALMYLCSTRGNTRKDKILFAALSASLFAGCLYLYNLLAAQIYFEDFYYFKNLALDDRFSSSLFEIVKNFLASIQQASRIEPLIYLFTLVSSLFLGFRSPAFRQNILVHTALLWMLAYFGVLSVTIYHPSRYFLPLIAPLAILFGLSISSLHQFFGQRSALFAQVLIVTFILITNGSRIIGYLNQPQFTFVEMAQEVQKIMQANQSQDRESLLLGNFASGISLATGIHSTNTELTTQPLPQKLKTLAPQFYVSLGHEPEVVDVLSESYELQQVADWDVFNNYMDDKKVYLFKLIHKSKAG